MIRSLRDVSMLAGKKGPKELAVLAPEDEEFMKAVKIGWERGYIEPVLIGDIRKMEDVAAKVAFDIGRFKKIPRTGQQEISDLGIRMLFSGESAIASKGQITTSYIYRSIIREEAKAGSGMTVSVISFWDIPGIDHLVAFTDTGVNIKPNVKIKAEIVKN
ncbi:MAG: phosphate butyryltransferase, partial [Syntrophales bacterium]|nr:phosphate butyryltransferase [Syntrophales bacterium]